MLVGDKIKVWWNTFEKDEDGNNLATVLEILPYHGPFDFVECIARLTAPGTKKGYLEMSIEKGRHGT